MKYPNLFLGSLRYWLSDSSSTVVKDVNVWNILILKAGFELGFGVVCFALLRYIYMFLYIANDLMPRDSVSNTSRIHRNLLYV